MSLLIGNFGAARRPRSVDLSTLPTIDPELHSCKLGPPFDSHEWALACVARMLLMAGVAHDDILIASKGTFALMAVRVRGVIEPVYWVYWPGVTPACVQKHTQVRDALTSEQCDAALAIARDHLQFPQLAQHLTAIGLTMGEVPVGPAGNA